MIPSAYPCHGFLKVASLMTNGVLVLKIFCRLFFGAFQRTFISDKKLKRFRTELKCSKVLIEIILFNPKPF